MSMVVNHSSDLMCVQRPYLIHKQLNSLSTNIHGTVDIITHSTQEHVTCHRLRIFCCRPSCCFIAADGAGWQMEENSCKYFPNTVNNSLAKYPALRRRCSHKPRFASSIRDPAQPSPAPAHPPSPYFEAELRPFPPATICISCPPSASSNIEPPSFPAPVGAADTLQQKTFDGRPLYKV